MYYDGSMKATVHARLDPESQAALDALVRRLGWSRSRVVRQGLRVLAACYGTTSRPKIVGAGCVGSGVPDLGSNKKYLEGFGR